MKKFKIVCISATLLFLMYIPINMYHNNTIKANQIYYMYIQVENFGLIYDYNHTLFTVSEIRKIKSAFNKEKISNNELIMLDSLTSKRKATKYKSNDNRVITKQNKGYINTKDLKWQMSYDCSIYDTVYYEGYLYKITNTDLKTSYNISRYDIENYNNNKLYEKQITVNRYGSKNKLKVLLESNLVVSDIKTKKQLYEFKTNHRGIIESISIRSRFSQ